MVYIWQASHDASYFTRNRDKLSAHIALGTSHARHVPGAPSSSTIPCPPSCAADVDPSEESARSYSVMNHADETIIRISRRLPEEAALASPAVAIQ
jgi:hypothetical protein